MTDHPKACVIGDPVEHSLSPIIHGYWLRQMGIAGRYEKVRATPDEFPSILEQLAANGYSGANITIPHKTAAAALVDQLHPSAYGMGAVNTIWYTDNRLIGANSDVTGFLAHLDGTVPKWRQTVSNALVIGAGGAARAIVAGLSNIDGISVSITNRTLENMVRLIGDLEANASIIDWHDRVEALPDVDLVVNTTSLGMAGQPSLDLDLTSASSTAIVSDIVYTPLETPLLAAARARDLRTVDGLGMLLHQAVLGFEKWFGQTPVVDQGLRDDVRAHLAARA